MKHSFAFGGLVGWGTFCCIQLLFGPVVPFQGHLHMFKNHIIQLEVNATSLTWLFCFILFCISTISISSFISDRQPTKAKDFPLSSIALTCFEDPHTINFSEKSFSKRKRMPFRSMRSAAKRNTIPKKEPVFVPPLAPGQTYSIVELTFGTDKLGLSDEDSFDTKSSHDEYVFADASPGTPDDKPTAFSVISSPPTDSVISLEGDYEHQVVFGDELKGHIISDFSRSTCNSSFSSDMSMPQEVVIDLSSLPDSPDAGSDGLFPPTETTGSTCPTLWTENCRQSQQYAAVYNEPVCFDVDVNDFSDDEENGLSNISLGHTQRAAYRMLSSSQYSSSGHIVTDVSKGPILNVHTCADWTLFALIYSIITIIRTLLVKHYSKRICPRIP